jgi:hypothetical protein
VVVVVGVLLVNVDGVVVVTDALLGVLIDGTDAGVVDIDEIHNPQKIGQRDRKLSP